MDFTKVELKTIKSVLYNMADKAHKRAEKEAQGTSPDPVIIEKYEGLEAEYNRLRAKAHALIATAPGT